MKLLDIYTSLLKTAGLVVNEEGFVSLQNDKELDPAAIKGKRLVLPTMQQQRNQTNDTIFFHPFRENAFRGESEVMEYYRKALMVQLNNTIATLFLTLIQKAASKKEHAQLRPDQSEYLIKVKDVDNKTFDAAEKLLRAVGYNTQKTFVAIYTKPSGMWKDKKYNRVGVVSFPLYEELKRNDHEGNVFGVALRKKDIATFVSLFEYLFPNIDVADSYNFGSNDDTALFSHTLLKTFINIALPVAAAVDLFESILDNADQLKFDMAWIDVIDDLESLIIEIKKTPMLPGNEGSVPTEPVAATPTMNASTVLQQAAGHPLKRQFSPQAIQQPQLQPQPFAQPGYMQPQPGYLPQQMPGQYPTVPTAPLNANGKQDFRAAILNDPNISMHAQQAHQQHYQQYPAQRDRYGRVIQQQPQINYGYNNTGITRI